ncbi:hypothetical protein, partial [Mesorhizobium sp. M7A.F.Ca.US.001.02.1.1]|uniref:hypothetical protein n=1 Tax=Mesorhizobium sp. M7A.F.Ca.US.001.02.1.1 TaxID=2496703 RepID=UPI000FD2B1AE
MRFKNLDRYKLGGTSARMQLGVPLPQTPDGRVYRYSPNEQAHPRHFVLGNRQPGFVATEAASARMKLQPGSTQTVCPYSGIIADDGEFEHPDDRDAALKTIGHAFFADAQEHVSKMLKDSARGQRHNSALKITVSSTGKAKPKPRFTRKDLLRELVCDHCGRDFGVYAIGLFCPDCGAPNLRLHLAREVEL